jgi:hypothetical protein
MSSIWTDDIDSEADYDSEGDYDSEADYDSEDVRSDATRRARARQIALARRRVAAVRSARPLTAAATPSPRQTVAAIRNLDLETKVGESSLRTALEAANRRARRATYVTVASVAVDQALDSFRSDLDGHDFVRAGMRFAPILLLPTQRTRSGLEGIVTHPWFIGGTAVAGILAAGEFRNRASRTHDVIMTFDPKVKAGSSGRFTAVAVDGSGAVISSAIAWAAPVPGVLTVETNGDYRAAGVGTATVTATAGGHTKWISVNVVDDGDLV